MNRNVDFSKLSNAEINMKIIGYDNEYNVKKSKIIEMIKELENLDYLYIKATNELNKRGNLSDG
jgi:hypothetical protein